jgi:hypothetical protein
VLHSGDACPTQVYYTRIKTLFRHKHSILLQKYINYGQKSFLTLAADCCATPEDTEKCAPVTVKNDPFYSNGKCLNFVRSLIFCEELGCDTDAMNILTAYVDGSNIYGSDSGNATQLKATTGANVIK